MQILKLTFNHKLNESLQVGDTAFYARTQPKSIFKTSQYDSIVRIGEITEVGEMHIKILWDSANVVGPGANDFIMFAKDRIVNTSSLIGYYADVQFKNNSTEKVELFAVSSEITESSK